MSWKVVAIIFILLFVVETIGVIYVYKLGYNEIANENECMYNVCSDYDSFYYSSGMCYCYKNNEIVKQEYIK